MLIKGGIGLAFILNEFNEWVHSVWLHSDWIGSLLQIMHVSLKLNISQKLLLSRRHILSSVTYIALCCVHSKFSIEYDQPTKSRERKSQRKHESQRLKDESHRIYENECIASTLCGCFGCVWITNWQKFSHIILGYFQFYVGTQPTSVRIFDGGEILL